jgi:SAM-dependent methyltransferase
MERILEPELMDDPAQARAYGEADFASSDQAFVDRILALLASSDLAPLSSPPPAEGKGQGAARILDLGCGPGNISFPLAAALPDTPVLGLDGAGAMLELAERRRQAAPERWPRLRFHQACLPLPAGALEALPAPFAPPYTLIVSNSLLHHLHDPSVLWRAIVPWAAPGALVVVRDLRRPADPQALRELVERHAATAPPVLRRDYAHSLAAAFRPEEVAAQLAAANLTTLRVEPLGDRYLEISGRLPPRWQSPLSPQP